MTGQSKTHPLFESEPFCILLESAPDAMIIVDAEGYIVQVNAQTERIFGFRREELYRRTVEILIPDRFKSDHMSYRAAYVAEPRKRAMGGPLELYSRHKEGYEFPVEISLSPLATDAGLFVIAAVRDVTERIALQARLYEANKLESLGRLAGGVAHDFNNLLTAIIGYTELAREEVHVASNAMPFLNQVYAAAERASEMTRQLLAYGGSQIAGDDIVDLNAVILRMAVQLSDTLGTSYQLTIAMTTPLWRVGVNTAQMELALFSLIGYILDTMPNGGHIHVETANVNLDAHQLKKHLEVDPGEYVMIAVSDCGPCIPQEKQDHLFEPFFTSKYNGVGSGLRLATCYNIVRHSGGCIMVDCVPAQGNVFTVYFPRCDAS